MKEHENPGIKPRSTELQVDSLPAEPQGEPQGIYWILKGVALAVGKDHLTAPVVLGWGTQPTLVT